MCLSSGYGFWLPIWYFQTFLVNQQTHVTHMPFWALKQSMTKEAGMNDLGKQLKWKIYWFHMRFIRIVLACVVAEGIFFPRKTYVHYSWVAALKEFVVHAQLLKAYRSDYVRLQIYTFSNTLAFKNLRTYKQLIRKSWKLSPFMEKIKYMSIFV